MVRTIVVENLYGGANVAHSFMLSFVATKLGRTPLWVDLDPADNSLSVPGTLSVAPMTQSAVSVETFATSGLVVGTSTPLVMWYGHSSLDNTDLFAAQIVALAAKMDKRMENDTETARASGILVNTNGWIQNVRFCFACGTGTACSLVHSFTSYFNRTVIKCY
jgi:polyribonucleotide 5'-hydroxyl-kinase